MKDTNRVEFNSKELKVRAAIFIGLGLVPAIFFGYRMWVHGYPVGTTVTFLAWVLLPLVCGYHAGWAIKASTPGPCEDPLEPQEPE